MEPIDSLDARILLALDDDPETTTLALARSLGIARNTVHARLRRMTDSGALRNFSRRVDPAAMGYQLVAFISIAISQSSGGSAVVGLQSIPEVVEIHAMTGEYDFLAKVVARDTPDLLRVTNAMLAVGGVVRTNTAISLVEAMPMRLRSLLEAAAV
ncbi:MAG: Lrp/AsnC family transcriptional regulator [Nakamurella sp.]